MHADETEALEIDIELDFLETTENVTRLSY